MRKLIWIAFCSLAACTPPPAAEPPQNFEDLLKITDVTTTPICTLSLKDLRSNMTPEEIETAKTKAFDLKTVAAEYNDNRSAQIRVLFRRSALKRRLNVSDDKPDLAEDYYQSFRANETTPTTLIGFHDRYHYWMDRIGEQSQYGGPESAAFNLRFCVMNEKRAELHAASRQDILSRIEKGVVLPAPNLIENINHEMSFQDGFADVTLGKIITKENINTLTPLQRAQIRGDKSILPTDPKSSAEFWEERDEEISAMLDFIQSHTFSSSADKLTHMTDIDQSLRKLWGGGDGEGHFENSEQYGAFKAGISARVLKVDDFNTAELQKMLEGRGWFRDDVDGRGAANDAWLIAQHADLNPEFQKKALTLIEAELGAPGVSKSNYAYLYDRVQIRYGDGIDEPKPLQRYATQGRCSGPRTWEPFPFESPEKIDDTRAEVGLGTLAEYKKAFKSMCTENQR